MKTRPQFPKLACMVGARHLTPPSPGVGTLFCLLTDPGGMQVGIWQETQSLHKRCRSQGSSWAELSEAGQLREHRARGVPGQDSSSCSPSRMHTSCCHRAHFPESWPYPWRRHRLPVELPYGWDTLIPLVPESSPSFAEWLYFMVWGTRDRSPMTGRSNGRLCRVFRASFQHLGEVPTRRKLPSLPPGPQEAVSGVRRH